MGNFYRDSDHVCRLKGTDQIRKNGVFSANCPFFTIFGYSAFVAKHKKSKASNPYADI